MTAFWKAAQFVLGLFIIVLCIVTVAVWISYYTAPDRSVPVIERTLQP